MIFHESDCALCGGMQRHSPQHKIYIYHHSMNDLEPDARARALNRRLLPAEHSRDDIHAHWFPTTANEPPSQTMRACVFACKQQLYSISTHMHTHKRTHPFREIRERAPHRDFCARRRFAKLGSPSRASISLSYVVCTMTSTWTRNHSQRAHTYQARACRVRQYWHSVLTVVIEMVCVR